MIRRALFLAVLLALAATASAAAAKPAARSWAQAQIQLIVAQGILGTDVATFRPDEPLTRADATALVAGLTRRAPKPVSSPSTTVSIANLDSRLVAAIGLKDAASTFQLSAKAAGLAPPTRFGTEAAARLLGLRTNHPAAQDDLELLPADPSTRAEAAFSAARFLRLTPAETEPVRQSAATFVLPPLTAWQKRILTTAFGLIGYPYVWGGTTERAEAPFGVQARGGFDCSGFVWRVFKLQAYPGGAALSSVLRGRTTYQMSGEVPAALRIPFASLAPGDLVFFGANGARSKPSQVDHMGIYVGSGWMIHSSGYGVALTTLTGWYRTRFAWARRPLAEAGLAPAQ